METSRSKRLRVQGGWKRPGPSLWVQEGKGDRLPRTAAAEDARGQLLRRPAPCRRSGWRTSRGRGRAPSSAAASGSGEGTGRTGWPQDPLLLSVPVLPLSLFPQSAAQRCRARGCGVARGRSGGAGGRPCGEGSGRARGFGRRGGGGAGQASQCAVSRVRRPTVGRPPGAPPRRPGQRGCSVPHTPGSGSCPRRPAPLAPGGPHLRETPRPRGGRRPLGQVPTWGWSVREVAAPRPPPAPPRSAAGFHTGPLLSGSRAVTGHPCSPGLPTTPARPHASAIRGGHWRITSPRISRARRGVRTRRPAGRSGSGLPR